ncbi:MAG: molecular chaperone HtpG [SAR324 cluster bacterium]|jgi:molecular chaperone HtpG|nr:molecular chaperone HtpG [SAR324 cluster bacterium]
MSKNAKQKPEVHQYQAEMQKLLEILVHSLYTEREIFLRELVSNASDALSKVQLTTLTEEKVLDKDADLQITISFDEDKSQIVIEDSGCGMTKDELIDNLGTIANSGTLKYLQQAQAENKSAENLIGQFGVGFYSVFMVADRVELTTRSWQIDAQAWQWSSDGGGQYEVSQVDYEKRGTRVTVFLKEDAKEFCSEWRLESIIKKYSNYLPFPVKLKDKTVNQVKAIWTQSKAEVKADEYKDFYKQISHSQQDPLHHLHFNIDAPIQYYALLYFPESIGNEVLYSRESKDIALYAQKVLIQSGNTHLLPSYLRFVQGVVDSEDIPLNVSRESVQKNALIEKIKNSLTLRVLKELQSLSEQNVEKYGKFWQQYGTLIKEGISADFKNKNRLMDLLRFNSSISEDSLTEVSLKDYVSRMREEQKDIYYVTGGSREAILHNPNLEYFRKQSLEVLFMTDQIDDFMVADLREYDGKSLKNISQGDIDGINDADMSAPESSLSKEEKNDILAFFEKQLKDRVSGVSDSKRLVDSPCSLVTPKDGMTAQMEKMMKMMDQKFKGEKRNMEVNMSHPIIQNLSEILQKDKKHPFLKDSVEQLYDNSMLVEGLLEDPVQVLSRFQKFMESASAYELEKLS